MRVVAVVVTVVVLMFSVTACGLSVGLPGTLWTVTAIEGAGEMSTGQTIEFPNSTAVNLSQPCGEFRAPMTLDARSASMAFGPFEEERAPASCPAQIAWLVAPLFEALALVSGWRVVSPDTIELTGGPVVRLDRTPSKETHRIGVEVLGSRDGWPKPPLVLQIGEHSWAIDPGSGGGVAETSTNRPLMVWVVRPIDCRVLTSFLAPLDSNWLIQFTSESRANLTDVTDGVFETGPNIAETTFSRCP